MVSVAGNKTALQSMIDDGNGEYKVINTPDPAANAEISYTIPVGPPPKGMLLLAARVALVTDANVANRVVTLTILDDNNAVFAEFNAGVNQAATLTTTYTWSASGEQQSAVFDNKLNLMLPQGLYLPSGYKITTVTTARQVGDNYGPMNLYGIEWTIP